MYETVVPPLEERDFEKTVAPIVQEYFEHADANEVAVSVVVLFLSTSVLTSHPLLLLLARLTVSRCFKVTLSQRHNQALCVCVPSVSVHLGHVYAGSPSGSVTMSLL